MTDSSTITDQDWERILRQIRNRAGRHGANAFDDQYLWGGRTRHEDAVAAAETMLGDSWRSDELRESLCLDLSGQWADGMTEADVLDAVSDIVDVDPEDLGSPVTVADIVDAYRDAYDYATLTRAERSARAFLANDAERTVGQ